MYRLRYDRRMKSTPEPDTTPCQKMQQVESAVECFFFQAEDGIRDGHVTGVQTCALPIFRLAADHQRGVENIEHGGGFAALIHMSSFDIKQANTVVLRCPIDPDEPLHIFDHC